MARQALLAAVIVVIGVSGCAAESPHTQAAGSGVLGTGSSTPPVSASSTPAPGGHSCPPRLGPSTDANGDVHDMVVDYADILHFNGHDYQSVSNTPVKQADLGVSVGHVVCTLSGPSHIDPGYHAQDGDATFVAVGSTIYAVKGTQPDRELAAEHHGVMHLYKALPAG